MSSTFWPIIDIEYVDSYAWVIIPPRSGPSAPFEEWDDISRNGTTSNPGAWNGPKTCGRIENSIQALTAWSS